jgi:hypothetical protein
MENDESDHILTFSVTDKNDNSPLIFLSANVLAGMARLIYELRDGGGLSDRQNAICAVLLRLATQSSQAAPTQP